MQVATGETVKLAWADQGYTGEQTQQEAKASGIDLQIVKLPEARKRFVLLPRRWVVERSFGWLSRFRALASGAGQPAFRGLRHPHAPEGRTGAAFGGNFITRFTA